MDYVGGERQDWVRWWSPLGLDAVLDDGMLADPEGLLAKYSGRWKAQTLADLADVKCLVLLGEPGSGKSDEMVREQARLADLQVRTLFEDLGEHGDWSELKEAIFGDPEVPVDDGDETVLFLDAFDEATQSIDKVAASLARALRKRRTDRLKLRIACRPGVWSDSFGNAIGNALGCQVEKRTVLPLSVSDIRTTAAGVGLDSEALLSEVRDKRIGPLAATPITLSLLLRLAAEEGGLPDNRRDVYEQGVALLADENDERRRGQGKAGPPVTARVGAAKHLAAVSLLSNRPVIIERARVGSQKTELALDEVDADAVPLEHLKAIWDSGLLSAGGDGSQRWVHRSIAEYMAAQRLVALPTATIKHLVGDSSPDHHVIPQLAEVAIWLGAANGEVFEWLAQTEPQVLLASNLRAWPHATQRKLLLALLAHLTEKHPPSDFQRYRGLDYPELASDLLPYLESAQPYWVQREVIHIVIDTKLRDLDRLLMHLIKACISERAADDYTYEETGLATIGCLALTGTTDQDVLANARRIVLDANVSVHVRSALTPVVAAGSDWSSLLSDLTAEAVLTARNPFSRNVARELTEALESDRLGALAVIDWLSAARPSEMDADLSHLVGAALLALPRDRTISPGVWGRIGMLCREVDEADADLFPRWPIRDRVELPAEIRLRVSLETLRRAHGSFAATFFVRGAGLATTDDVRLWLEQLAVAREQGDLLSIDAAKGMLTNICPPTPENIGIARAVLGDHPALLGWFDIWSSEENQQAYRENLELSQSSHTRSSTIVTTDDLQGALEAGDWPRLADLLTRNVEADSTRRHSEGTILSRSEAWELLSQDRQDEAVELARRFLQSDRSDEDWHALSDAYGVVSTERSETFDALDAAKFANRIPALFDLPNNHAHMATTLWAVRNVDTATIEDAVEAGLRGDRHRQVPAFAGRLGRFDSQRVTDALAELCGFTDIDPWVLHEALPALLYRDGSRGRAIALEIVEGRPAPESESESERERDLRRAHQRRAEVAAVALLASDEAAGCLGELLEAMSADARFRTGVISTAATWFHRIPATPEGDDEDSDDLYFRAWAALPPDGLATVYLWARRTLAQGTHEPGVIFTPNPEEELASQVHGILRGQETPAAQAALDRIAATTGNVWDKTAAADMRRAVRASTWSAPSPTEVAAILEAPARRVVTSESDLAEVVLEVFDGVAAEIEANPDLRALFWHRQAGSSPPIPATENEFSTQLAMRMQPLLTGVSLRREVQLYEAQLGRPGARPDLEATVADDAGEIVVLTEVKGDWHRLVVSALRTQLVNKYLGTGRSKTGIYIAAWYDSDLTADGKKRRARRRTIDKLRSELEELAAEFSDPNEAVVYVRVIDLSLPDG